MLDHHSDDVIEASYDIIRLVPVIRRTGRNDSSKQFQLLILIRKKARNINTLTSGIAEELGI